MSSRPFDLDKLDYETHRRRQRRKMLIWSLAPVLLVGVVALWFILPSILTHEAIGSYKHGSYAASRRWLIPLTWTSPEPFVIAFNSGTVDTKLKHYERAEVELNRALAIAPNHKKKCMAAQNLVISLKAHADDLKSIPKQAQVYEVKAATVRGENEGCFRGSAAQGGGSSQSSSSQSQALSTKQQQQLQQKEQEGQERQKQYSRDDTFNPNDPKIKRW
ncbi:hypothetical protein BH09PAT4_BH09PAT4_06460 [soil metagenome]